MSYIDLAYKALVTEIIVTGEVRENRTGVNTQQIWGAMIKHDLQRDGFPLLTQKKMATKTAFTEMLGFVRGETDVDWYSSRGCKIWEADHARWHGKDLERDKARLAELCAIQAADHAKVKADPAYKNWQYTMEHAHEAVCLQESVEARENNPRSLGMIYGHLWRDCGEYDTPITHDQLKDIITALKAGSNSRRLIMSAWMPHRFHLMCLPPCHVMYHFSKSGEYLDVSMMQRSVDVALGLPYNLANTALLTHLVAHATGLKPGQMVWTGNDVHVYLPHLDSLQQQFSQTAYAAPMLKLNTPVGTMPWDTNYEDIELMNYQCSEKVPFELFVG